jgi:multidrug efflux pump subunit AcrA (membrane-fusion protein)
VEPEIVGSSVALATETAASASRIFAAATRTAGARVFARARTSSQSSVAAATDQEEKLARRRSLSGGTAPLAAEELAAADHAAEGARAAHAAATARVQERAAEAQRLRAVLAETELRAPFAGVVAVRYATPGAMVAKATPVLRLVASDDAIVRFAVPETEMGRIARAESGGLDRRREGAGFRHRGGDGRRGRRRLAHGRRRGAPRASAPCVDRLRGKTVRVQLVP